MTQFLSFITIITIFSTCQALGQNFNACCELFEDRDGSPSVEFDLAACIRSMSEKLYTDSLHTAVPFVSPHRQQGPTLAVAVLSRATENIYPYAAYSLFIQGAYAQHNGYMYLPSTFFPDEGQNDDYRYHRKLQSHHRRLVSSS